MRRTLAYVALALATSSLACSSSGGGDPNTDPKTDTKTDPKTGEVVSSSLTRNTSPVVSTDDRAKLAEDNLAFALDMTKRVAAAKPNANVALSPHSFSSALAMLYAGAHGDTATEMAAALHFTLPAERLHPAFDALDLAL